MQVEGNEPRRRFLVRVEFVDVHGEDCKKVAVRLATSRLARTHIARRSKIRPNLHGAIRDRIAPWVASAPPEREHVGRDVEDDPMPKTLSGRGVRIVYAKREALCPLWSAQPIEHRRDIAAGTTQAVKDLPLGNPSRRVDIGTRQSQRFGATGTHQTTKERS